MYLHEGSPLAERPVGRQTLALLALYRQRSLASVGDGLPHRRPRFRPSCTTSTAACRPRGGTRSRARRGSSPGAEQWAGRLAALQAGCRATTSGDQPRVGDGANRGTRRAGAVHRRPDRRLITSAPARAPWAEHLDYLQDLLARYVRGGEEVVVALRGLERFTALEARSTSTGSSTSSARDRDAALRGRARRAGPGAFARRGVNVVAVNSLAGIEFARVWILGATERAFPPPARQDPILLDDERERSRGGRPRPRAARGARQRGGAACSRSPARRRASGWSSPTRAARPARTARGCRRCSSASSPRSSRASGSRPSDAPLLERDDVERIPGDAIGAPIPGGRYAHDPLA
jgi:hypothetical protein